MPTKGNQSTKFVVSENEPAPEWFLRIGIAIDIIPKTHFQKYHPSFLCLL